MPLSPGQIYRAFSEDNYDHFVIVVSDEKFNRGDYVHCVPVTSKKFEVRSTLPNCVPFDSGQYCFTTRCVAQCDALTLMIVGELSPGPPIDTLNDVHLREVIRAIGHVLGSECEPLNGRHP